MSAESDNTRAPPSTTEILRIEGLRIEARTDEDSPAKLIVDDVDLVLHRGEVLGLIGESGAGKSTIGLAALGYTRPGCTHHRRQDPVRRGRSAQSDPRAAPPAPRPPGRLYRPERGRLLQSCQAHLRTRSARGRSATALMSYEQAKAEAIQLFRELDLPSPETFGDALSASGLRRPASARHGRHGDDLPARHTRAGRADHGARRDDPDRGAGLDPQAHPRASHGGALHQSRPRRGGADGQPDHGAPPRQDGGGGRGRSDPAPAADGLHPRLGLDARAAQSSSDGGDRRRRRARAASSVT